jgi:hypothetical protein
MPIPTAGMIPCWKCGGPNSNATDTDDMIWIPCDLCNRAEALLCAEECRAWCGCGGDVVFTNDGCIAVDHAATCRLADERAAQ